MIISVNNCYFFKNEWLRQTVNLFRLKPTIGSLKTIILYIALCLIISFGQLYASDEKAKQAGIADNNQYTDIDEWDDEFDEEIPDEGPLIWDPLEKLNRGLFLFNDKLYFWCIKPVAKTYKKYTPSIIRTSLFHFFQNLGMPQRAVNCTLQLKPKETTDELFSFIVNTTIGGLGFTNAAENYFQLKPHSEDLGQTLGWYGIGNGLYIVIPALGSSSLRDLTGKIGDMCLDPINYISNYYIATGVSGLKTVNSASFRLGEYEALKEASFEPYSALKDAYIQYRNKQIDQ